MLLNSLCRPTTSGGSKSNATTAKKLTKTKFSSHFRKCRTQTEVEAKPTTSPNASFAAEPPALNTASTLCGTTAAQMNSGGPWQRLSVEAGTLLNFSPATVLAAKAQRVEPSSAPSTTRTQLNSTMGTGAALTRKPTRLSEFMDLSLGLQLSINLKSLLHITMTWIDPKFFDAQYTRSLPYLEMLLNRLTALIQSKRQAGQCKNFLWKIRSSRKLFRIGAWEF